MKISKKKIVIGVAGAILLLILGWRLWPHSFERVLQFNEKTLEDFYCIALIQNEDSIYLDNYELQSLIEDDEAFQKVMNMLKEETYREDFRNLLPKNMESVSAGMSYDGESVLIKFVWGGNGEHQATLTYHSSSLLSVDYHDGEGLRVYHPTNRKILDQLVKYIKEQGVLKE